MERVKERTELFVLAARQGLVCCVSINRVSREEGSEVVKRKLVLMVVVKGREGVVCVKARRRVVLCR